MATINLITPTSASAPVNAGTPFVGLEANDSKGTTIRESFIRINARLGEIYGSQNSSNVVQTPFVDADNIKASAINESHLNANNAIDGYVLTYNQSSGGFTWEQKFDGDITGIVAGGGLTGDATSGDASLAVGAGTGITVNANDVAVDASAVDHDALSNFVGNEHIDHSTVTVTAGTGLTGGGDITATRTLNVIGGTGITANADDIQISDNGVDHDQLAARYTEKLDISTTTGTINLNASLYAIFELTGNVATATLNIQSMKKGTVIDIILSGSDLSSAAITLADSFTTSTISKVGSTSLDTAKKNLIQVVCLDDNDSDALLSYAIANYETNTTP
jgi:hypothetical protein